jgi:hydrogenase expression/formation protein HypC
LKPLVLKNRPDVNGTDPTFQSPKAGLKKCASPYLEKSKSCCLSILGVRRKVDLGLIRDDRAVPGDWVLIHVGFAMSKISEADALDQMRMLTELGESESAMEEVRGYGLGGSEELESKTGTKSRPV